MAVPSSAASPTSTLCIRSAQDTVVRMLGALGDLFECGQGGRYPLIGRLGALLDLGRRVLTKLLVEISMPAGRNSQDSVSSVPPSTGAMV